MILLHNPIVVVNYAIGFYLVAFTAALAHVMTVHVVDASKLLVTVHVIVDKPAVRFSALNLPLYQGGGAVVLRVTRCLHVEFILAQENATRDHVDRVLTTRPSEVTCVSV